MRRVVDFQPPTGAVAPKSDTDSIPPGRPLYDAEGTATTSIGPLRTVQPVDPLFVAMTMDHQLSAGFDQHIGNVARIGAVVCAGVWPSASGE